MLLHVNAKRMTIIDHYSALLHWTQTNNFQPVVQYVRTLGAAGGEQTFSPLRNWNQESKFYRKPDINCSIPLNWLNYCNYSLFANMTLTLHKSQVHHYGVIQWWACRSLICLRRQIAKLPSGLFYCWCLLCTVACRGLVMPGQARRQDLAAGGAKHQKEGPKTRRVGPHF